MRNTLSLVYLVLALATANVSARDLRKEHRRIRPRESYGSCGSPEIQYGTGLDGNTAPTFKPVNQKDFPHGAASDLNIITSFICQRLQSPCDASSDQVSKCQQFANSLSGQTGGQAADRWNADFGIGTNFAGGQTGTSAENQATTTTTTTTAAAATTTTTPAQQNGGVSTTSATTTSAASASQSSSQGQTQSNGLPATATSTTDDSETTDVAGMINNDGCVLQAILVTVTVPAAQATGSSSSLVPVSGFTPLDLGTCTDPTVAFGQGLGGRQANEWAFMNNNISQFPHGSTLDLATILQFTCNNLVNRCGLSTNSPAVITCNNAEVDALTHGNTGLGVDTFNRDMGFVTYYAAVDGS